MDKLKKINTPIFKRNLILIGMLSTLATYPAAAVDSFWNNNSGNNQFFDPNNWDTLIFPYSADNVFIDNSNGQTVILTPTPTYTMWNAGVLSIGRGAGNNASLKIVIDPATAGSVYEVLSGGSLNVGSDGGIGRFEYDTTGLTDKPKINYLQAMDIGAGLNSNGKVTLTGSGKSTAEQNMSGSLASTALANIGSDNGIGELNIIGSSIEIDTNNMAGYMGQQGFSLGSGTNSQGSMNVLAGGKALVSASAGSSVPNAPGAFIGVDGGLGNLTVSGHAVIDGEVVQSRTTFGQGLEVGKGSDSLGYVRVENGGLLSSMAQSGDTTNIGAYLGMDGGSGSVVVSGTDSQWIVGGHTAFISAMNEVGNLSIGETGSGSLTLANGGHLAIGTINYQYEYDGTHSFYRQVFDDSVLGDLYLGRQANGNGTLNIGAAENQTAQAVGTLAVNQILIGDGAGTVVFNHTDNSGLYEFEVDIVSSAAGQGAIKHLNGVTAFNTDRSLFTGSTLVSGGTLLANSILGGVVSVSNSGTLAGSGTVGTTSVLSGGILSPGAYGSATPTVFNINGDLTMAAGATYVVDISADGSLANPYTSDLTNVSGTTRLNGAFVKARTAGNMALYVPGARWHILSSVGDIIGQFGKLTAMPFVNLAYEYEPHDVYLVVTRNSTGFCTPDMTSNECNTAVNIEGQGGGGIYDVIVSQPSLESAKDALNQLSGEFHASAKGAMLEDSRFIRDAVNNRLRDRASASGSWGHAFGSWGKLDSTYNAAELKRNIGGFFIGADKSINQTWKAGLVGGYSRADLNVAKRNSSANRDDYHLGTYLAGQWDNLSLKTGASYTWHDYSSDRYVRTYGFQDHLTADYTGSTTQLFAESSYQVALNNALIAEPFINAAYVWGYTSQIAERGGIARLEVASDRSDMFFTTLGSRFVRDYKLSSGQAVTVWGSAGWRHAYSDVTPKIQSRFAEHNISFSIQGTSVSRDLAIVEYGAEMNITPNAMIGVNYNGQLGDGSTDHGAKAYINWRF